MIYRLLLGLTFLLSLNNVGAQSTPNVVVSIKPIHSIVTALMEGISEPQLLLESSDSAHTFHLKPSQLNLLSNADLVITIGDGFETGLKKTLRNIKVGSHIITSEIDGLHLFYFRNPDTNEVDKNEEHEHADNDLHLWLDIDNMQKTAQYINEQLIKIDPNNRITYETNLVKIHSRLNKLKSELQQQIAPFSSERLQYFQIRFSTLKKVFNFKNRSS